jgi:ribosomal protein S17
MFEKLVKQKSADYLYNENTEDSLPARNGAVDDEQKSSERYRVEITTERVRQIYSNYQSTYTVFDTHDSAKQGVYQGQTRGDTVQQCEEQALSRAKTWIKEQKEINEGPVRKTVFLD